MNTARTFGVSAVLPAFNEQALIARTVRNLARVLHELTADFEILVVDDGSRDATPHILHGLAAESDLRLQVITHERNQGYGAALASGFDAARCELILLLDADGQFDPAELCKFLSAMDDDTDLVVGWRRKRADPPIRVLNAWGWKLLVNTLFGYTARDVDCAFKLFRRFVWQSVTVRARGATFSAELLTKARRSGFRIEEVAVNHYPRRAGSPTGARPGVIARAFKELVQLRVHLDEELAADPRRTDRRALEMAS
jgi:glycosyltransferase involved in cell wall biosynthesis